MSAIFAAVSCAFRFLTATQMQTLYFLGLTFGGGLLALFLSAGWSSFKHKKIPEKGILFRWFVAGIVTAGLIGYTWIFGSGGDVGEMMNRIGGALDLENVMKITTTMGAAAAASEILEQKDELTIGMPNF